jgi:deoxyuridine 5'-triphosphate nucleotidohydrolase
MSVETVRVRLIHPAATLPSRGTPRSAGFDLYASETTTIPGSALLADGGVEIGRGGVPTGIAIAIPTGLYGRVAPRSGLALRAGIDVGAGVIDPDYRDELVVLLFNFGSKPFEVRVGQRVAQIVFERVGAPSLVVTETLDVTERIGGFGSTGS